jgi:hypothetical protein
MISIDEFLKRFESALAPLPAEERTDLVAEIGGHLREREKGGAGDPLAGFGGPEEYAKSFLSERELAGALEKGGSVRLLRALARAARGGAEAVSVLALLLLHLFGLAFLACGVAKVVAPSHTGLFVDADGSLRNLGFSGGYPGAHEVLGWWSLPLFLLAGAAILWGANRLLRTVVRRRLALFRAARR